MCTCPCEGSELPDDIERTVDRCWMKKTTGTEHLVILWRVTMKNCRMAEQRTQHTRHTSCSVFKDRLATFHFHLVYL